VNRREFITLLGGAATAWPLAAPAQQSAMPVVGFLGSGTVQTGDHLAAAFRKGLAESGFVDGRNVTIEYRWLGGRYATVQSHLADLLKFRPTVMTVGGIVAAKAAQAATQSVPVLFTTAPDPVAMGLVASLNRPGGNLTGFSVAASELTAKRFGLLHELLPTVSNSRSWLIPTISTPRSTSRTPPTRPLLYSGSLSYCRRARMQSWSRRSRLWRKRKRARFASAPMPTSSAAARRSPLWRSGFGFQPCTSGATSSSTAG
jgi:putative tryptophan/tyrosine transport system substrate-binding protein